MLLKSISSHREEIPVRELLVTDQFGPWHIVLRQVFTPSSHLLISPRLLLSVVVVLRALDKREYLMIIFLISH